jgi:hypothetical protein
MRLKDRKEAKGRKRRIWRRRAHKSEARMQEKLENAILRGEDTS